MTIDNTVKFQECENTLLEPVERALQYPNQL